MLTKNEIDIPRLLARIEKLEAEKAEMAEDIQRSSEVLHESQRMIDDLTEQLRQERLKVAELERRLTEEMTKSVEWFDGRKEEVDRLKKVKELLERE